MKTMIKLQDVFRDVFDDRKLVINRDMTARDIEDWDSFAQINIITDCESVFKVHFEINEIIALERVGDMVDLIERKISA